MSARTDGVVDVGDSNQGSGLSVGLSKKVETKPDGTETHWCVFVSQRELCIRWLWAHAAGKSWMDSGGGRVTLGGLAWKGSMGNRVCKGGTCPVVCDNLFPFRVVCVGVFLIGVVLVSVVIIDRTGIIVITIRIGSGRNRRVTVASGSHRCVGARRDTSRIVSPRLLMLLETLTSKSAVGHRSAAGSLVGWDDLK